MLAVGFHTTASISIPTLKLSVADCAGQAKSSEQPHLTRRRPVPNHTIIVPLIGRNAVAVDERNLPQR